MNLQPGQIKEAIPNVVHRIMFENRFNNFLKNISSQQSVVSGRETNSQMSTNGNRSTISIAYDEIDDPVFDESFDLINVASSSSAISKSIPYSTPLKKGTVIKTVQVKFCS